MFDLIKSQIVGIIALVVVVLSFGFGGGEKEEVLGTDSTTFSNPLIFSSTVAMSGAVSGTGSLVVDEFTQGAGVVEIASGAQTLTQAQLASNSVLVATASTTAATFTWTLPATSTLTTLIPTAGDSRMWLFKNENASATTTTIAAGTGIVLDEPDGQNVVIAGGNRAKIECWRDDNTDVICSVDELIDAD